MFNIITPDLHHRGHFSQVLSDVPQSFFRNFKIKLCTVHSIKLSHGPKPETGGYWSKSSKLFKIFNYYLNYLVPQEHNNSLHNTFRNTYKPLDKRVVAERAAEWITRTHGVVL